jgi:uncharacterized protein (TIGR03083 family)
LPPDSRIVETAHLYAPLHEALLEVLGGLTPAEWDAPTVAPGWRVRDVAAHLLDGDVRVLSLRRDGHTPRRSPGAEGLQAFLDRLNADWLGATDRLSSRLIVEFLALTGPQVAAHYMGLDPRGPAYFAVAWAGEAVSENWMDIGRDFTERWHHQQQIRDATGRPALDGREWLSPVLAIAVRALPVACAALFGREGDALAVELTDAGNSVWSVEHDGERWCLRGGAADRPRARVTIDGMTAARVWHKLIAPDIARTRARIEGDEELASAALRALAVMATRE